MSVFLYLQAFLVGEHLMVVHHTERQHTVRLSHQLSAGFSAGIAEHTQHPVSLVVMNME